MKHLTWLVAVTLVVLFGASGEAHHSLSATYRLHDTQTIDGVIVQVAFREPHSFVHVQALDQDGFMRRWSVEWDDAARLFKTGVTPRTLRVGDRVRVTGHPGRNAGTYRLLLESIARPVDGWTWGGGAD
jgi:hypothetical protein